MSWDLACPDWEERLRSGRSLVPVLPLNEAMAARAVAAFNKLRLADVPGTPTMAEAGGEWFRDIVRALFGSLDQVTKARMIRELFLLVAKKNSKTTNGALLMLVALLLNERPKAPFIMTAPVQDVAELAFNAVSGAIALDPVLEKKLHVREHLKTIVHRESGATLEIMTFDPAVVTGRKVVGALIDEVHVLSKMAKAASALRQLRGGMLPFPEAFLAMITTQSEEQPAGVFRAELQKARSIRDGKRKGAMLPVLFEFPESVQRSKDKAWKNPELWPLVTPNAGKSITIDRLKEEFDVAESVGIEELCAWASQHLNVEIGLALHSDGWAGALFWEAQGEVPVTLDDILERCEVVTVGIDGGGLDDMLGLAVVGRDADTGEWLHWGHAWIHPIALERRKAESQRYGDFADQGDLTIVEQIGEDVEKLVEYVRRIEETGLLDKIGVDPAGIGAIVDAIIGIGIEFERIVGIPQGWKMVGAIKTTERKLAAGEMRHGGSPLMAWCVSNAKAEPRGNAVMITKQVSGSAKIDPLMALFDAVALMSLNPEGRAQIGDFLKHPVHG